MMICNYLSFLIEEIWVDWQDNTLFGIILFSVLARFSLICRMWALPIIHIIDLWGEWTGLSFWVDTRGLGVL